MNKYFEQACWALALLSLFFMDTSKLLPSFCVFKFIGFKSCLGCGIGHSIHSVLHLNFSESFKEHVLGIPATIAILYQIFKPFTLLKKQNNLTWTNSKCL